MIKLKNIKLCKDDAFVDKRGIYWTSWKKKRYNIEFNHDKFSLSKKNVLRGFHGDKKSYKLISCVYGKIFFVIINNIPSSSEYLKYSTMILTPKNRLQILIPPNFLTGHLVLSKESVLHYKFSYKGTYPDVKQQISMKWNDFRVKIPWPIKNPILSVRDK
jgi:dTDP-4-dehydrorhamnose 3,5-epimerase